MIRKYFGTDGIRGQTNTPPMTAEIAMKAGMAAGSYFARGNHQHRVVIGKDTRLSGYMIEPALVSGFISVGMDVILVGPMPTPAIAMLTKSLRADLGVMVSASHNSYQDNGIKLFGPDGLKLTDEMELEIEALMQGDMAPLLAEPHKLGRAKRLEDEAGRYIEYIKQTVPHTSFNGLRVIVDCANGAAYRIAPTILWELEAEVIPIGVNPNGFNINQNCGSTYPHFLASEVQKRRADIGIALDGDADRLLVCDEKGKVIDGDQLIALIATRMQRLGQLTGDGVVVTHMSNLGLQRYLDGIGLHTKRTSIGDRYVLEAMENEGYNLGGEQSGHIILRDYSTTGDGLLAALQILVELVEQKKPASEILQVFDPVPQKLHNIRFNAAGTLDPLAHSEVQAVLDSARAKIEPDGRLMVRKSGTEPVIRVMVETEDVTLMDSVIAEISAVIERVVGKVI